MLVVVQNAMSTTLETKHLPPKKVTNYIGYVEVPLVGLRFCEEGHVNDNEDVVFVRHPGNEYDENAIQVHDIRGKQVGHLAREYASFLAPVMDRELAWMTGYVPECWRNSYKVLPEGPYTRFRV
eukprot:jgi/Mesen1/1769/ME000014S01175